MNSQDSFIASDSLIKGATIFHGHLGPYLVLGLKAGLVAIEILGRDPFKMQAIVETSGSPPSSCFIDGIQFTTGCTMGKGNIRSQTQEGGVVSALFIVGEKMLEVKVKLEVLEMLKNLSFEEAEKLALSLIDRKPEDLFDICQKS
jgi:formylmethanofuran dehydrogenase subunit E